MSSSLRQLFVSGVLLLLGSVPFLSAATLQPGDEFPDWAEFELTGSLPDLSGAQVTIVDFWASWCAPCKASFPAYDKLHREFASKGVVIVAVNVDQNEQAMRAFLERMDPQFAVVRDGKQQLVARVEVPAMPTAFVLDAQGVVRFVHAGFHGESSLQRYREQIRSLLSVGS